MGGQWLERGESAVLQVPSAIVIEKWNYLLNPVHADFGKLRLSAPEPFSFDRRVARLRNK
jgi:RES domain-containing protein